MIIPYPSEVDSSIAHLLLSGDSDGMLRHYGGTPRPPTEEEIALLDVIRAEYDQHEVDHVQGMAMASIVEKAKLAAPHLSQRLTRWLNERS